MRELPRLAECRDCHEPIRFVSTPTGSVPVQPRPSAAGTVAAQVVAGRLHGHFLSATRPAEPADIRFTPHAAVCTDRPARALRPEPTPDPSLFDTEETAP